MTISLFNHINLGRCYIPQDDILEKYDLDEYQY